MIKTSISCFAIFVFFFFNAVHAQKIVHLDSTKTIQYSEEELVLFLSSVEKIKSEPLMNTISAKTNLAFRKQKQMKRKISKTNFEKLLIAIDTKEMEAELATAIFGKSNVNLGKIKSNDIGLNFYSFDEITDNFEVFGIYFNESHELFFIKNKKVIAKHIIHTKLLPDLHFYKDSYGKTIFFYDYELMSGSGIWQNNYFFYRIDGEKVEPVLNQIHLSNLRNDWSDRHFSLETTIESFSPLTFKITYEVSFLNEEKEMKFINDTALIKYVWNDKTKQLEGNFTASKLNEAQLTSFYIEGSDLLFLKSFYPVIKMNLREEHLKGPTLKYLNEVKNALPYRN